LSENVQTNPFYFKDGTRLRHGLLLNLTINLQYLYFFIILGIRILETRHGGTCLCRSVPDGRGTRLITRVAYLLPEISSCVSRPICLFFLLLDLIRWQVILNILDILLTFFG